MGIISHDTDILTVYGGVCKWGNVNLWGMFCGTGRLRLLCACGWWGTTVLWRGWGMAVVAMADARAVSLSVQLTGGQGIGGIRTVF